MTNEELDALLAAAAARHGGANAKVRDGVVALVAEVRRAREALERIASRYDEGTCDVYMNGDSCITEEPTDERCDVCIAREALGGGR